MKYFSQENILISFWFITLLSINSLYTYTLQFEPLDFYLSSFSIEKIFSIFNLIRFYIPFLLTIVLGLIILSNKIKKPEIIIVLFGIYYLWQLFALFISDRYLEIPDVQLSNFNKSYSSHISSAWDNLNLVSCAVNLLLIFYISKNLNLEKFNKKILIITIIFIGFISFYFTYHLMVESIQNNLKFIYGTDTLNPIEKKFEQANPRITGISRMLLIIFFLIFCYLLKKKNKIILYILGALIIVLIYKMQARGTLVGVALSFILFFFFTTITLKKKLQYFVLLVIIPITLFESYYLIKKDLKFTNHINKIDNFNPKIDNFNPKNRLVSLGPDTSGRLTIWKNTLFIIKEKKIILGYGPQADRVLLLDFKNKYQSDDTFFIDENGNRFIYDNNASNAFLYAYLCGGIIGLFSIVLIYIATINLLIKKIFFEKIFSNKYPLQMFLVILLVYLCFRGFFENSISLFGIDFVFFILAFIMLNNKNLTKQI